MQEMLRCLEPSLYRKLIPTMRSRYSAPMLVPVVVFALVMVAATILSVRRDNPWHRFMVAHRESAPNDYAGLAEVERELAALAGPHPWAGRYEGPNRGFGGKNIFLTPSGRYCINHTFDFGSGGYSACGRMSLAGDRFVSSSGAAWETQAPEGPPFMIVPWGKRRYLVPERQMLDFVNDVNNGKEPRETRRLGSFVAHLRSGDEAFVVEGPPSLPAEYERLLRPTPISTRVTRAGLPRGLLLASFYSLRRGVAFPTITTVILGAGMDSGVFKEMRLEGPEGTAAQVMEVWTSSCAAEVEVWPRWGRQPRMGDVFSTNPKPAAAPPTGR